MSSLEDGSIDGASVGDYEERSPLPVSRLEELLLGGSDESENDSTHYPLQPVGSFGSPANSEVESEWDDGEENAGYLIDEDEDESEEDQIVPRSIRWEKTQRTSQAYTFEFNLEREDSTLAEDILPEVLIEGIKQAVETQGVPLSISPHFRCHFKKSLPLDDQDDQLRWISSRCFIVGEDGACDEEELQSIANRLWTVLSSKIENYHQIGSGYVFLGFTRITLETFKFLF